MAPAEQDSGFETAASQPAASQPALLEGRRLGRYRLEGMLGRGAMATVVAARDLTLHRQVALKLIHAGHAGGPGPATPDDAAVRRLVREAQAIAKISHPNVIHVYDAGWEPDGTVYVAMEQIAGVTLDRWLEQPRSSDEIYAAFAAAGAGLAAAHSAGLIHRDFKPQNVMVGDDGRVRVLDFGLACAAEPDLLTDSGARLSGMLVGVAAPMTAPGALIGTPAYLSPEQWRGERAGERSDQFSFCVALFQALARRHPFELSSRLALRRSVLAGLPEEALEAVPRAVRGLLRRGLAVEAARRFPSMNALLAQLPAAGARRRKRLALAGAAAALALSAAALAALAAWRAGDERAATSAVVYLAPERLTGRGDVRRAALSPDEQTLAYLTNDALMVQALRRDAEPRVLLSGRFVDDTLAWSPGGGALVVTAALPGDGAPGLTLVEVASGRARRLGGDRGEASFVDEEWLATARFTDRALSYVSTREATSAMEGADARSASSAAPPPSCSIPGVFSGIRALTRMPRSGALLVELDRGDRESSLVRVEEGCRAVTPVARSLQSLGWIVRPSDERILVRWMYRHALVELDGGGRPTAASHLVQSGEYRPVAMRQSGDLVHLDTSARWQLVSEEGDGFAELVAGADDSRFAFSSDGSAVAQISGVYRDGVLRAGELASLATRGTQLGTDATRAAWSPDGARLAVLFQDQRGYQLAVWHRQGGRWSDRLTVPLAYDGGMGWLDERRVGFGAPPRWREVLWMDPATGEQGVTVLGGGEPTRDFARAPRSGRLAFLVERGSAEAVEVWTLAAGAAPEQAARLATVAMATPRAARQPRLTWQHDEEALLLYDMQSGERWRVTTGGVSAGSAARLRDVPLARGGGTSRINDLVSLPGRLLIELVTSSTDVYLSRRAAR